MLESIVQLAAGLKTTFMVWTELESDGTILYYWSEDSTENCCAYDTLEKCLNGLSEYLENLWDDRQYRKALELSARVHRNLNKGGGYDAKSDGVR